MKIMEARFRASIYISTIDPPIYMDRGKYFVLRIPNYVFFSFSRAFSVISLYRLSTCVASV